jgi:hypothetical protein
MFHVLNNIKFIWVYPEFISGRDHKGRAFRYNLFLFKEKSKRIFTAIPHANYRLSKKLVWKATINLQIYAKFNSFKVSKRKLIGLYKVFLHLIN